MTGGPARAPNARVQLQASEKKSAERSSAQSLNRLSAATIVRRILEIHQPVNSTFSMWTPNIVRLHANWSSVVRPTGFWICGRLRPLRRWWAFGLIGW